MTDAAIHHALQAFRLPVNKTTLAKRIPSSGMLDVIKLAAGDEDTISRLSSLEDVKPELLVEVSKHYLRTLIAGSNQNPHIILGLKDGASAEDIRLHKRWLLKWLHPDRNGSKWESVLFKKVNAAALALDGPGPLTEDRARPTIPAKSHRTKTDAAGGRSRVVVKAHGLEPKRVSKWKAVLNLLTPMLAVTMIVIAAYTVLKRWYDRETVEAATVHWLESFRSK